MTKRPREATQRERFILYHDFRGPWLAGSVSLRPVERQTTWLQKHVRKEDVQFLAAGKKRGGPVFFSRQNKFPPFPKWGLSLEHTPVWAFAMSYEHQCTTHVPIQVPQIHHPLFQPSSQTLKMQRAGSGEADVTNSRQECIHS